MPKSSGKRSVKVIERDLERTRDRHHKLNTEIDTMHQRQALGNSMDLQRMKNTRASLKVRISALEVELADAQNEFEAT
jgi:hypothetical protein